MSSFPDTSFESKIVSDGAREMVAAHPADVPLAISDCSGFRFWRDSTI
jgi:hypothetical protein